MLVKSIHTLLEALHVTRSESDADLVKLHRGHRGIDILVLGDVAHFQMYFGTSGDQVRERIRKKLALYQVSGSREVQPHV